MVAPLLILGAVGLASAGIGTGLALSGDETHNTTYQTTNQTSNYTKKVSFSFDNAKFEKGSNFSITDTFEPKTNQSATPTTSNKNSNGIDEKKLLIVGAVAIGLFLYSRGKN